MYLCLQGFPGELTLNHNQILWMESKVLDWVVFICFAKLLKPSVDSDFRVILNTGPSSRIRFACAIRSQSVSQDIKLGYFLATPKYSPNL